MARQFTCNDLLNVVEGDVRALSLVLEQPHEVLRACAKSLTSLTVTRQAVRRVLTALLQGDLSPDGAQKWASLVRRGFAAGSHQPVAPIDIDYEPSAEQAIVEAVSRLDEIGDLVDGEVTADEISEMLDSLSDC